jgi:aryl-alcohol dehydrogenase-like predicted oxidoreductase
VTQKKYEREQILIASKAGFVGEKLHDDISKDVLASVVNDHCVHPLFLSHSLSSSLQNLGLKTLDVFYINNFP